jgi:aconitate hydratase
MSIHLPSIRKPNGNGSFRPLIAAGRLHQSGCMGCIGMGQAPATNTISLRTMPRNFPGRSGTLDDKICSPETAAAALTGKITDQRDLETLLTSIHNGKSPLKSRL